VQRFPITVISLVCLFFCFGCKNKKNVPITKTISSAITKEIKKIEFIAPADSSITAIQIKNWLACNSMLDSLAIMYADSFVTENAQMRLRYQDDYSSAQDKICVLSGLPGGYIEYKWVMENIGNPKNKSIVESANAAVY
jgi:hypothetical protein